MNKSFVSTLISVLLYISPFLCVLVFIIGVAWDKQFFLDIISDESFAYWALGAVAVLSVILFVSFIRIRLFNKNIRQYVLYGRNSAFSSVINDEIAATMESVRNYISDVDEKLDDKQRALLLYEKMVPHQLLELLSEDGKIKNISVGEVKVITATIMNFKTVDVGQMLKSSDADRIFKLLNTILADITPLITGNGGIVNKYENKWLSSFYVDEHEKALETAVHISDMLESVYHDKPASKCYCLGITHGSVMTSLIGNEERMSYTAISEQTGFSQFISSIGEKYAAHILITDTYRSLVDDFDTSFNSRLLGYFYLTSSNSVEKIYDVYDVDEFGFKKLKRKTKILFEKGVTLFVKRDFYNARLCFIEVLKANRNDLAAKRYLDLCDKYTDEEYQENDFDIYLEVY